MNHAVPIEFSPNFHGTLWVPTHGREDGESLLVERLRPVEIALVLEYTTEVVEAVRELRVLFANEIAAQCLLALKKLLGASEVLLLEQTSPSWASPSAKLRSFSPGRPADKFESFLRKRPCFVCVARLVEDLRQAVQH